VVPSPGFILLIGTSMLLNLLMKLCLELIINKMKEIIGYVLSFIFVIFMTLGLFGAFDKDKDNPFINKK
jgi:hypothetical protein